MFTRGRYSATNTASLQKAVSAVFLMKETKDNRGMWSQTVVNVLTVTHLGTE